MSEVGGVMAFTAWWEKRLVLYSIVDDLVDLPLNSTLPVSAPTQVAVGDDIKVAATGCL